MKLLLIFIYITFQNASSDQIYEDFFPQFQDAPSPLINHIVQHPLFKRLHRISQLSSKELLFTDTKLPIITRAAHSIGTRVVSSVYINILNKNSEPDSRITPIQSHAIQVAALLHDIGHGPYSHVFQDAISRLHPPVTVDDEHKKPWTHEQQSARMVRHLFHINDYIQKYDLPEDFADAVCDMIQGIKPDIHGKKYSASAHFNTYLIFTIVNGDNQASLDVDKFDYMRRDSYTCCRPQYAGLVDRAVRGIIENSRIHNGRIVYNAKVAEALVLFSHCVYLNYRYLYYTPESEDFTILERIIGAFSHSQMSYYLNNIDAFSTLDDETIETLHLKDTRPPTVYKFIAYCDYPHPEKTSQACNLQHLHSKVQKVEHAFQQALTSAGSTITEQDYVFTTYNFARILKRNGTKNILEKVSFYNLPRHMEDFYNYHKYLAKYSFAPGCISLFDPRSRPGDPAFSYETDPVPFYWGSLQLRLHATTQDPEKISELKALFMRCTA